jgi:ubiquitin C-terminal hydrolase
LCRVLFEAIESSLYETEENFIGNLYEGSTSSIVKCLQCSYESEKKDKFLDISLPIRNEFENVCNNSLEMAFTNFLKIEKLEKDNQYYCEQCDKKVDAHKYLKFTKLPKILFLQLNRFEYDYMSDSRRKICDKVTFPLHLDMNPFIK